MTASPQMILPMPAEESGSSIARPSSHLTRSYGTLASVPSPSIPHGPTTTTLALTPDTTPKAKRKPRYPSPMASPSQDSDPTTLTQQSSCTALLGLHSKPSYTPINAKGDYPHPSPHPQPSFWASHRNVLLAFLMVSLLCFYRVAVTDTILPFKAWSFRPVIDADVVRVAPMEGNVQMVDVELFVMSKCPDAVYCEGVFANVLAKVLPIVHFATHYIATPNASALYGATCKHGDDECKGNIQQLCIRSADPNPSTWYNYLLCSNRDYRSIPSTHRARACAKSVGLNYDQSIKPCVDGHEGRNLLVEDAQVGRARGISTSCTVVFNKRQRCVRDGGRWRDCEDGGKVQDFVRDVCLKAYDGLDDHGDDVIEGCKPYIGDDSLRGVGGRRTAV
ncbi:hypothetical protein DFS34DRAFT_382888 [Phlyctochytrium arcticum]|nr:hypothetical protein DFS34DRAFT_382888 [Phlyctochytrium arcticum]